jgi:hypothetical protein
MWGFFLNLGTAKNNKATPKCVVALTRDRAGISQVMAWSMPWPTRSGLRPGNLLRSAVVSMSKRARGARAQKTRWRCWVQWIGWKWWEFWRYDDIMLLINVVISCYIILILCLYMLVWAKSDGVLWFPFLFPSHSLWSPSHDSVVTSGAEEPVSSWATCSKSPYSFIPTKLGGSKLGVLAELA